MRNTIFVVALLCSAMLSAIEKVQFPESFAEGWEPYIGKMAQNATMTQLKMFLTRMGRSSKFIITGDCTQIDLPKNQQSGLLPVVERLQHIKDISVVSGCDQNR